MISVCEALSCGLRVVISGEDKGDGVFTQRRHEESG